MTNQLQQGRPTQPGGHSHLATESGACAIFALSPEFGSSAEETSVGALFGAGDVVRILSDSSIAVPVLDQCGVSA
jgi:hypothetical protein